jgi:uncharacterized protein YutE (UPF0331/DUF86 family)
MSTTASKYNSNTTKVAAATATAAAAVNITQIVDAVNGNFTKLVNEAGKVQPHYAQAISNLQQEYIEAVRNTIQTIASVEKQFANSNSSNSNNVDVIDTAAPWVQGFIKQLNDFTNNLIRIADIDNQQTINVLNALRENVKNFSRTVEATTEFNSNMARAWATSYSAVQQQFATRGQ